MQRKKYTQEFKDQVIKEAIETGNSAVVARRYDLSGNMVARWVREFRNGKHNSTHNGSDACSNFADVSRENQQLSRENDQLKKLLGEKELEIEILKDLIKKKNPHLLKRLK